MYRPIGAGIRLRLASNHELSVAHAATPLRKTALNYRTVSGAAKLECVK
jgi:hypothetical protein